MHIRVGRNLRAHSIGIDARMLVMQLGFLISDYYRRLNNARGQYRPYAPGEVRESVVRARMGIGFRSVFVHAYHRRYIVLRAARRYVGTS